MDRRWTFAAFLTGLLLVGASPAAPPLREAQWIAPERRAIALSQEPPECLILPKTGADRDLVALGRHLFRAPLLLGGQAARAGLSCASCHRNGRGNPDFLFPGLSGAAGTADVTSSLMSRTRGDGQFNPVPIPDLARDAPKVSRDPASPVLESFIHGLITQEFDGREPPPRALASLAAYVRALRAEGCRSDAAHPLTLAGAAGDIVLGLSVVRTETGREEPAVTRLALGGIRDRLGSIAARYPGKAKHQRALAKLDRGLLALQSETDAKRLNTKLAHWEKHFTATLDALARDEAASRFAPVKPRFGNAAGL